MKRILSSLNIKRLYASFAVSITQGENSIGRTFEYNGSNISIYKTFQLIVIKSKFYVALRYDIVLTHRQRSILQRFIIHPFNLNESILPKS